MRPFLFDEPIRAAKTGKKLAVERIMTRRMGLERSRSRRGDSRPTPFKRPLDQVRLLAEPRP
ncbi:MAG: hypothetical protein NVSMB9_06070 [Isosphaeraceae bacterium]